ncbi:ParB N-terminal domain-containing protein [Mesorhizobium sp. M0046]|uniref:ParB/RepB/Spo0J family partition protein n=1 Tax=Mesorhizobium sp. M0046 TaxID=2956858 RepID=UPI003335747D
MTSILISTITVRPGRRKLDPDWVRTIADSFAAEGQHTDIEVVGTEEASTLVFGGHRLAAAQMLGWVRIKAEIRTAAEIADEAQRKLREISENLMRRELSVLDRAVDIAAWREIYEATHLLNTKGGRPRKVDPEETSLKFETSFSEAARKVLDISRPALFRVLKIASIHHAIRELISLHAVADNQSELLALAAEPVVRQGQIAALLTAEPPQAGSIADAIAIIDRTAKPAAEPRWQKLATDFSKMKTSEQDRFFELHEAAIQRWMKGRQS